VLWIITPACPNSTQCVDSKETSASAWFGIELVDVGYARFYGAINDAAAGCDEEESTRIPERGSGRKGADLTELVELTGWHRDYGRHCGPR